LVDERWPLDGGTTGARERYRVSPPPRRVSFDETMRIGLRTLRGRRGGRSAVDVLPPRNAPGAVSQRELETRAALVATAVAAVRTEPDAPSCLDVDDAVLEAAIAVPEQDEQAWTPPQLLTSAMTDPALAAARASSRSGRHAAPKEKTTNWRALGLGALGAGCTALLVAAMLTTMSEGDEAIEPGAAVEQQQLQAGAPALPVGPAIASVDGRLELTGADLLLSGGQPAAGPVTPADRPVLRLAYEYEPQDAVDQVTVVWLRGEEQRGSQVLPMLGGPDVVEVPAPVLEPGDWRAEVVFNGDVVVHAVPFTVQP
jgi:hypothetical protein